MEERQCLPCRPIAKFAASLCCAVVLRNSKRMLRVATAAPIGLTQSPDDVLPVYLDSCDHGTVRWSYPRGALRIVVRRSSKAEPEFQACFRVGARSSGALVYIETPQGDLVPGPGARAKCVLSHEGAVVVYVVARPFEAASSVGTSKKPQLTMTYTTGQPVASFERLEGWEECRPCTETELRESYCFSDLVAEAMVRNTTLDPDHRSINWWLSVSQTHRGRMPEYVTRPTRCGFPRDTQEARLILARWHLGRASVTCAPKLSQWERLVRRGKPQCKYEGETAGTDNT
ncbi:meteorin-like protein isoform X1 [Haemaphysalis longicornis]